jgi:hypothetical protein
MHRIAAALLLSLVMFTHEVPRPNSTGHLSEHDFALLMKTVADAWNEGNARKAADCFAEDAVYREAPDRQLYVGQQAIYDFFGGPNKPDPPMHCKFGTYRASATKFSSLSISLYYAQTIGLYESALSFLSSAR